MQGDTFDLVHRLLPGGPAEVRERCVAELEIRAHDAVAAALDGGVMRPQLDGGWRGDGPAPLVDEAMALERIVTHLRGLLAAHAAYLRAAPKAHAYRGMAP